MHLIGALGLMLWLGAPFAAHAELIEEFTVDITPSADGSLEIVEEIVYDFGSYDKHGIFREVPLSHPQEARKWYLERYIEISDVSVLMDGENVPFEVKNQDNIARIKIGDAATTITGLHTYTLRYKVVGGLSYFENGGTDLYWNVSGHEWSVPIKLLTATVHDPEGLLTGASSCYLGARGSTASCGLVTREGSSMRVSARELAPGVGLTIAYQMNAKNVAKVILERIPAVWLIVSVLALWFIGLGVFVYRHLTFFKTGRTIVAEYEPFNNIEPMYTGLLMDGRLDPKDITAGLVYLASQGFITIRKMEKKVLFFIEVDDYEVTLRKHIDEASSPFHQDILKLLFDDTSEPGKSVTLGDLKHNYGVQAKNRVLLAKLSKDASRDLVASGYFEDSFKVFTVLIWCVGLIGIFIFVTDILTVLHFFWTVVLVSAGILFVAYRRRTRKGYEAEDHLKGFKDFLSVTDKERFAFHNAPEKNPEQFLQYLPYAIAFGVEEKWAAVFKDITIPNPSWYEGGNATAFSASNLTTSLGAFSTAFASSSGTSASSGGGSSGGGAGGGGGGSW